MANTAATSTGRRSQVHTEVRAPIEAVLKRVTWFIFGFIEVLLAIRFVLVLLGANTEAGFVRLIYGITDVLMAPFAAIFSTQSVAEATFEWSVLVAIAVYALIAWAITALIDALSPRDHSETVEQEVQERDVTAVR